MKTFFYRLFYLPPVNRVVRGIIGLFGLGKGKFRIPVTGTLYYKVEGKDFILSTNETCYVTTVIYWEGGPLNYEYTPAFLKLASESKVFFDIGAQLGFYSILGKLKNPNLEVYCFEPSIGPKHYLDQNLRQNNLEGKIHVEYLALSDKDGQISFFENYHPKYTYVEFPLRGGNNFSAPNSTFSRHFSVPTKTLDSFVKDRNVTRLDLIKIDTEGTEDLILNHGRNTIETLRPVIICEVLPQCLETAKNVKALLDQYGYHYFYYHEGKIHSEQSLSLKDAPAGVTDYFLVPPDKLKWVLGLLS